MGLFNLDILRSAFLVPIFASGAWLVQTGPPEAPINFIEPSESLELFSAPESWGPEAHEQMRDQIRQSGQQVQYSSNEDAIISRRLRIERILITLDGIAAAALQMNPDQAVQIEPVLVELAEQTLLLTSEDAVLEPSTDGELTEIEETVEDLVVAVERMVEPEMSL